MTSKIRTLPDLLINQIAAGEVIENPASVVKELVENAIDARARHITVKIAAGGRQHILVSDDGDGMTEDDAVLCFERHATSKIASHNDLSELVSMGFRGEAIPSIASVSKMKITTCIDADVPHATEVICEGGKLLRHGPASHDKGTTVSVRSLFYNVPVRREFLKSITHDTQAICRLIAHFALCYLDIAFTLYVEDKKELSVPVLEGPDLATLLYRRMQLIYGEEYTKDFLPVQYDKNDIAIVGWTANPNCTRPNRKNQLLFINKRLVDSQAVAPAVKEGYGMRMDAKRYPLFVLSAAINPKEVDCNVHPQKLSVRFKDAWMVSRAFTEAIDNALQVKPDYALKDTPASSSIRAVNPFFAFSPQKPMQIDLSNKSEVLLLQEEQVVDTGEFIGLDIAPRILTLVGKYAIVEPASIKAHLAILGEKKTDKGLVLFDTQAMTEQILYEQFIRAHTKSVDIQQLLIPLTITCSTEEMDLIKPFLEDINKMGLSMRELGEDTLVIDGIPAVIDSDQVSDLVFTLIGEIMLHKKAVQETMQMEILSKALARAGRVCHRTITEEKATTLLKQLLQKRMSCYTVEGKKILTYLSYDVIEKQFI